MLRALLISLTLFLAALSGRAAESPIVDTGQVNAQLVSSHDVVAPGQSFYIALRTQLDPEWHTYWRNPGDSGEPVQITWNVADGLSFDDIIWPLPDTITTGPIVNYGFEGTPFFPVKFTVSQDALPGELLSVKADVYYLVCKTLCVPEGTTLDLMLTVGDPVIHDRWNDLIHHAVSASPKTGDIKGGAVKDGTDVIYNFANLPDGNYNNVYFFPFEQGVLDHSTPQSFRAAQAGQQMRTRAGYGWDNDVPKHASGILRYEKNGQPTGSVVTVTAGQAVDIGTVNTAPTQVPAHTSTGIWAAIIGAFIGGLILNLMPCVFPIISMKALSVTKLAHDDQRKIRREGWVYTAGIVATMMLLAATLLVIKAGGTSIGWGFQLQSPILIAVLAIIVFVIGLNLLGMFDIGPGLQSFGADQARKSGAWGTFMTGALAVIVATPCTAPFMAGAIGMALLSESALISIVIFLALASGFAAPFLLLAYSPRLMSKLPKPGSWMTRFREFLAFPMFGTAIWLVWTLAQQAGAKGVGLTLIAMLLIGFAIWLWRGGRRVSKGLALAALGAAVIIPFTLHPQAVALNHSNMQSWSPDTVKTLRAEGRAVFVDFTAAWCVTCQANKKLVLDKDDVQEIFTRTQTAFLVADWTNKNDMIADELARHGRSGVPLYLYYPPGHDDVNPVILPQILSKSVIETTLTAR